MIEKYDGNKPYFNKYLIEDLISSDNLNKNFRYYIYGTEMDG